MNTNRVNLCEKIACQYHSETGCRYYDQWGHCHVNGIKPGVVYSKGGELNSIYAWEAKVSDEVAADIANQNRRFFERIESRISGQ